MGSGRELGRNRNQSGTNTSPSPRPTKDSCKGNNRVLSPMHVDAGLHLALLLGL